MSDHDLARGRSTGMDPYGGYNPHQPGDDFTTSYRPLPPLPAHLHRIYHSNPPSPDPQPRPISSAGSTPAGDSDKASPNLNGNPQPPVVAPNSASNSAKKRERGRAAERSEEGSSRVQSPANGAAVGQDDGTAKEGKAPAKRAKVRVSRRWQAGSRSPVAHSGSHHAGWSSRQYSLHLLQVSESSFGLLCFPRRSQAERVMRMRIAPGSLRFV